MARNESNISEAVEQFIQQENLHTEGRSGVILLSKLSRALGYKDTTYFGNVGGNAYIGDFIQFLEDNSGAVDAIVEFVSQQQSEEWLDSLLDHIETDDETEEDNEDE